MRVVNSDRYWRAIRRKEERLRSKKRVLGIL